MLSAHTQLMALLGRLSVLNVFALWAAVIRVHSADAPDNFCLMNK